MRYNRKYGLFLKRNLSRRLLARTSADTAAAAKNTVIVAGGDVASHHNVFMDNAYTYAEDNLKPGDTIVIINVAGNAQKTITMDANGQRREENKQIRLATEEDVMNAIGNAFADRGIDRLIFESHSGTYGVNLKGDHEGSPIILWESDFKEHFGNNIPSGKAIRLNEGAQIWFTGCNIGTGGQNSFAQKVANITNRVVFAFKEKSSQKVLQNRKGRRGTYQVPFSQHNKITRGADIKYERFVPNNRNL